MGKVQAILWFYLQITQSIDPINKTIKYPTSVISNLALSLAITVWVSEYLYIQLHFAFYNQVVTMSKSPRYIQIKTYISDKISNHEWVPGHKIPTEIELTETFNVSRMTVNKAIRDLVSDGLLERTPRLGTFVCQKKAESPLTDIRNIADEISQRGGEYSNKVLSQRSIVADDEIAMRLGVMLGTQIYFSEIIHFEDNEPLQLEIRWVNPEYAPAYIQQDFSQATPNEYLSQNCPLSTIEHTVEAIVPDAKTQRYLNLSANEPCLLLNRRTWSKQNLISAALLYHPGHRYKLSSRTHL